MVCGCSKIIVIIRFTHNSLIFGMPKKVLIFSLAYGPRFWGGAELAVREITKRVAPEDVMFDMITLRFDASLSREEVMGNVRVHRIGFAAKNPDITDLSSFPLSLNKYLFPFLAVWKALALHSKKRYDATWAIMANYAGFAALFFKFLHPRVPFILTLQEGDPVSHIKRRVRFVAPLFRRVFSTADIVQAISEHLARFGESMGARSPVSVIPNGVDIKRFIIDDLGFKNEKENRKEKILITTSRLVKKNAIEDIIQSLAYLPDIVHLWILGEGPELKNLQLTTYNLKLNNRVHFLGQKNHDDLPAYLREAHVFIRPSLSEGLGNSFIEAMAMGIPIIGTPVGGIVDFLKDEETGLFCEVKNPKGIARQAARLFAFPLLREKIVANARRLALTRYDWNIIAQKFKEDIFAKV